MKTRIRKIPEYPVEYRVEALKPFCGWDLVAIVYNYNFARKVAKLYKDLP